MLVVVAYDTPSDRRRRRFVRVIEGYGERVQDSVFECWLTTQQWQQVQQRLADLVEPAEDRIRFYRFCGKDTDAVLKIGKGSPPTDVALYAL